MMHAPFFPEIAEGPESGAAYWTTTDDDVRLRIGLWSAGNERKGTVLLFPGRTEYIELQGRFAQDLAAHGYSVVTIDWRGHGLSGRLAKDPATIHVNDFADYQKDVAAMILAANELDVPKPWFLVGNSMGGSIGLRAIIEGLSVRACAFTAPMWGIKMSGIQRLIAVPVSWAACALGQGQVYVPGHDGKNYVSNNSFKGNRLTFDPDGYDYWVNQVRAKPELQTAGSSMSWLLKGLLECGRLSKLGSPDIPCIAFCGDHDGIVSIDEIENRLDSWPDGEFVRLENAKHALLFERPHVRAKLISRMVERFSES